MLNLPILPFSNRRKNYLFTATTTGRRRPLSAPHGHYQCAKLQQKSMSQRASSEAVRKSPGRHGMPVLQYHILMSFLPPRRHILYIFMQLLIHRRGYRIKMHYLLISGRPLSEHVVWKRVKRIIWISALTCAAVYIHLYQPHSSGPLSSMLRVPQLHPPPRLLKT